MWWDATKRNTAYNIYSAVWNKYTNIIHISINNWNTHIGSYLYIVTYHNIYIYLQLGWFKKPMPPARSIHSLPATLETLPPGRSAAFRQWSQPANSAKPSCACHAPSWLGPLALLEMTPKKQPQAEPYGKRPLQKQVSSNLCLGSRVHPGKITYGLICAESFQTLVSLPKPEILRQHHNITKNIKYHKIKHPFKTGTSESVRHFSKRLRRSPRLVKRWWRSVDWNLGSDGSAS